MNGERSMLSQIIHVARWWLVVLLVLTAGLLDSVHGCECLLVALVIKPTR